MALLRPRGERKRTGFRSYITIQCPYNGHQVSFCRGLCEPIEGHGHCGRLAPHAMIGRTCSMLDARCSMLDARCSMLDARCSMLDARCSMRQKHRFARRLVKG